MEREPRPRYDGIGGGAVNGPGTAMFDFGIDQDQLEETAIALAIFAGGIVVAWFASRVIGRVVQLATHATETDLDDAIVAEVRTPVVLMLVVHAAYIALRTLSYLDDHTGTLRRLWAAASLFVFVWLLWRVIGALFTWYAGRAGEGSEAFRQKTLPIVRRIVRVTIMLVGAVLVLDQLGIAISPLLAGLGIGGLALALAAQPILANIFAGSYVLSDGSISVGDFLEIEGGPTGWVDDIGWRATRLRTFDNNLIVIPNSTLAESTVTNFDTQDPPVGVPMVCGVAYEEDLERVEAVALEVLAQIVAEREEADPGYPPLVRFQGFGDSNIDFLMKLQARNRRDRGRVAHEIVKRIHTRFNAEGITINYPARRLYLQEEDSSGLERLARPAGSNDGGA